MPGDEPGRRRRWVRRAANVSHDLQQRHIADYVALLQNPWRLLWLNLLAGMARGVGYVFGLAVIGTLLLYLLRVALARNLPWISDFIAQIIRMVQWHLQR